ncbi:MAG: MFS transporter [Oligoflexia bacterium]|nr:MFS transporter [Oligoflexia bacterium]
MMDHEHPHQQNNTNVMNDRDAANEAASLMMQIVLSHISSSSGKPKEQTASITNITETKSFKKNMFGGVIGNILEWYDFAVFGFFAPVIGTQFFPSDDPMYSLLSAFSVFAAAFFARPLGGIIFGRIGDTFGRKKALQISVMTMALPTFLMGMLPTYSQVGVLAPFLLIILRMVQGLSVGGEFIGSMAFVAETAPSERQGYFSSWTFASCYVGIMLGSLSAVWLDSMLGPLEIMRWGWRIPFPAGIVIGLASIWMRKELTETQIFEEMKAAKAEKAKEGARKGRGTVVKSPLAEAVAQAPWRILHASTLVVLVGGGFYLLFVWWPTLLSRFIHPHIHHTMTLNTISMVLLIILIPFMGMLSDSFGRRSMLMLGSAGMIVLSWPLFMLAEQGNFYLALLAQLCFTVVMSIFLGPIPATLVEMFPVHIRYSAIGLAYNLSLCIFGGTAPLFATWLVYHFQSVSAPAIYLTFLSTISFWAANNLPEKGYHPIQRPSSLTCNPSEVL